MSVENYNSVEGTKAASPRTVSDLLLSYHFYPQNRGENFLSLHIGYKPLIEEADGTFSVVIQLSGTYDLDWGDLPPEIIQKLETLERILVSFLPSYQVSIASINSLKVGPIIREIICMYRTSPPVRIPDQLAILYFFRTQPKQTSQENIKWDSLSRSQQLVVSNITSWVKKQAWQNLANRIREISRQPAHVSREYKVFLSYKRGSQAESTAETIAHRLSQQNMNVWFDKWEIKAGDSVVGKIEEGFKEGDACLVFLDRQYGSSDWCTKEMNTALTKAINENFTIIPILAEECEKPELLKELRHIYLKDPSADQFEQALSEVSDAIYKVDLNPYR